MRAVETFVKMGTSMMDAMSGHESFSNVMQKNELTTSDVVILVIYLVLLIIFGKYLWNEVACKHVTVLKPLSSVWQLLGLSLLVQMFF
jgi:hypothetical protein